MPWDKTMTNTITHHLNDQLLMAYAAGTLPEAYDLIIAAHLSLCDDCRAAVSSYEALGGEVMDGQQQCDLAPDSLAKTLDLIRTDIRIEPVRKTRKDDILPAPILDYVDTLDNVKWRPVGMGVKQAIIHQSDEATARLLYIPAGVAVPDHGHNGLELTLVLKGAFEDEDGRFARGDIEVATEDMEHTPVADISEDCICLAVTNAPLKFKGILPRLAQPFLRI